MYPTGHALLGYLLFSLVSRARGNLPTDASIPWLLLGTQLPDLIDKPLAWQFGWLQAGRSLGHSVLVGGPFVLLIATWLRRRDREAAGEGIVVGFVSHLLGDVGSAVTGGIGRISFLVWPVLPSPEYSTRPSLWPPVYLLEPITGASYEIVVLVLTVLLWIRDGRPGLAYLPSVTKRLES